MDNLHIDKTVGDVGPEKAEIPKVKSKQSSKDFQGHTLKRNREDILVLLIMSAKKLVPNVS